MKDFYKTLGVGSDAGFQQIKEAYRNLSKKYHPDLNGGDGVYEEKFKDILEAYSILKDPYKRKEFDKKLAQLEEASRPASSQPDPPPMKPIHSKPRNKPASKSRKKSGEDIKKDLYMGGGALLFLVSAIAILVSLEKSFYLKESYLETIEETNKTPSQDSMELIRGFEPDSVYTSGAIMKASSK